MTGPWEKFQPAPDQGDVAVAYPADGPWTKFQASPITTEKQMLNRTAVAKTDDSPAPPETPGILTAVAAIPGGAARELGNQAMQASDVARGIPPRANLTGTPDEQALSQPIEYGWPTQAGVAKGVYQMGKGLVTSAPQWAGAVAGGLAGTAAGAELGPLAILTGAAGAASGAAMVSAVQEFGGLYREELDKTPNQPDAAFNNALKRSAISAAGSGASFGAFELAPAVGMLRGVFLGGKPVEKAATDAGWQVAKNGRWAPPAQPVEKTLAQQVPIQTGIAAAENTAQNAEQGKPLGEGLEQTIGAGALGVAVPMAAHAAIQHIAGLTAPMAPKALKGALDDIEQPPAPPGTPQTPEQIAEAELQQGEPQSTASDAGSTPGAAQSTSMPDESTPKSPGQQAIENVRAGRPATEGLPKAGEQQPEPPKGQWREVPQGQTPPADQMLFRHPDGRTFTFDPVAAEPAAEQPATESATSAESNVTPAVPLVAGTYTRPTPEERGARQAASLTPSPDAPVLAPAPAPLPTAENPMPGNIESLDPMQIGVDADRFQFKGGGDERGVTDRLQGVTQWNPIQAGVALVWRDPQGRDWVADGHQRVGLAQRLTQDGQDGIRVNAMILDSASGITDSDARALAAYRNIGEGSGSPIDAAKVIRESAAAGREVPQLPPRSALARDGAALARLGDQAFGMAINEVVPTNQAAVVGRLVSDPDQQVEALRLLAQAKPDNARQVDLIVRDMLNSGTETSTQDSLFGAEAFASSLVLERAKIADEAMNVVKRDRALFRTLVENAERIESQGKNTLDSAGNTQRLSTDEQAAAAVSQLATHHGPVSDALTAIARRFKNGEITRAAAGREFAEIVRSSIEGGEGQGGVPDNDRARNAPPRDEAAGPVAEPPSPEAPQEHPDQQAMFSKRSEDDAPAADLDHLAGRMVQVMAHLGMPDGAALHLVDQIDNHGANASYARNVIEFAMDTRPERFGGVLFHEVMHGLMDPANKLLTPTEVLALKAGAQRWLKQGDNLARLKRMYGEDQKVLGEEAVAHLAEEVLARARQPSSLIERVIDRIKNFIQGVRQAFHGEGYKTSDDVFRSILNGEVARRGAVGERGAASGEQQSRRDPLPPKAGPDLFGASKSEPEKRQPEFTVRNDPSQGSLFGGPSAVQAQASRDAQGRGALLPDQRQKPADEGLFARPEPVQPELAPRSMKPKMGNVAEDFEKFAQAHSDPHEAAATYVLDRGKATGHEYLSVVNAGDRSVLSASTEHLRSEVAFSQPLIEALDDPANKLVTHHNHPSSRAPSGADVSTLGYVGHKVLIVHGHNGALYVMSAGTAGKSNTHTDLLGRFTVFTRAYRDASEAVRSVLQRAVTDGRIPIDVANLQHGNAIAHALHATHIVDYRTTETIPDAHAKVLAEAIRGGMGFITGKTYAAEELYRSPFNLRTEGGLGPILRGSEELAQGRPWPENGAGGGQARGSLPAVAGTDLKPQGKLFSRRSEDEETGLPHLYSGVARATRELKQAKGSGEQMLAMLSRTPGVKPEELQWLGVADWLKGQKSVTKEQIADYVRANALQVQEVVKGTPDLYWVERQGVDGVRILTQGIGREAVGRRAPRARIEVHPDGWIFATDRVGYYHEFTDLDEAKRFAGDRVTASGSPTRYSGYLQPFTAGPTYREMLLKLPPKESAELTAARAAKNKAYAEFERVRDRDGVGSWATVDAQKAWLAADKVVRRLEREAANDSSVYKSPHWDEPNVLAHVRLEERTAPDGKRVLMVHELQSDHHQTGRREGYRTPQTNAQEHTELPPGWAIEQRPDGLFRALDSRGQGIGPEGFATRDEAVNDAIQLANFRIRNDRGRDLQAHRVPDAPFKTSWPQLAMKRVIAHAAEHGFDRVAWSPGEVHADRYSLASQIKDLHYADNGDGTYILVPENHAGREISVNDGLPIPRAKLADYVGAEVAEKIVRGEGVATDPGVRTLANVDLKVGGAGMKGFYDKILPTETQKLVGKYGAKVGRGEVHGDHLSFDQTAPDAQAQADHAEEWRRLSQQLDVLHQRQMRGNWDERNAAAHEAVPLETARNDLHAQMVRETRERGAPTHPVHQFDVTPELRRQVLDEGLPLFSKRDAQLDYDVPKGGPEILRDMKGITKAVGEVRAALAPTDLRGAKPMEQLARAHGGMKARALDRAQAVLEDGRKYLERMPQADQLMFTHRMETGEQQATPELTAIAATLRKLIDEWTKKVQGLGRGYLANAIEDYMGHIWGNYADWSQGKPTTLTPQQMQVQALAKMHGKRPLQGGASFLKQRTFPTQMDGIAAGLIPSTFNPIDLQLMKLREMQKFFYGTTLADQMKQSHLARWVPSGHEQDAENGGMVRLDDRVFQPRMYVEGVPGKVEPGNWYAAEPVARVFNNYMSGGLYGKSVIYDAFRGLGNAMNSLQLSFSGFHATFVTLDTMMSKMALGLQQIAGGRPLAGLANIALSPTPFSVISTVRAGEKLRQAWINPGDATPEFQKIANLYAQAGGRAKMDMFYRSSASGPFVRSLSDLKNPGSIFADAAGMFRDAQGPLDKAVLTPLRVAARLIDTLNEPLMGQLVPRAKMGVFADLAKDWLARHPDATPEEQRAAAIKMQDSIDNRMGQMVYDNVFWKKAQKDIAFIAFRSVGWNVGTVREIGGAGVDGLQAVRNMLAGKAPELTTRMAYTIAMPVVTAVIGAAMTYLATGQGPTQMLDYFFPPTGNTKNGITERRIIPGYIKDVIEYSKAPVQTVLNKTHPLISTLSELHQNRDYYGGIIYDRERDNPAVAYGSYLLNQNLPFSWRGQQKLQQSGASRFDQSMAFWGFGPAPQAIVNPEKGDAWQARQDAAAYKRREREPNRVSLQ